MDRSEPDAIIRCDGRPRPAAASGIVLRPGALPEAAV
jgi:hypothetical protein